MSYNNASIPIEHFNATQRERAAHDFANWPWRTAIFLLIIFAIACWTWADSLSWYKTNTGAIDAMADQIAEGQWYRQVAFSAMAMYGILSIFVPCERFARFKLPLAFALLMFVTWAMISIVWSSDRPLTVRRLVIFIAMITSVLSVVRRFDIREIAQIAWIGSTITMLVGICNEIYLLPSFPGIGLWRFSGTFHPNHAGVNCCIVLMTSLYLSRTCNMRKWIWGLIVLAAILLFASKSRTAIMAGLIGVAVYGLLSTKRSRAMFYLLVAAWIGGAVMCMDAIGEQFKISNVINMGRSDVAKADVTKLTGRTDIWAYAIMQGNRDPNRVWYGWGYESFWTEQNARGVSEFVQFKISEGHNVYLDWYLELGLFGVGMYGIILLMALYRWVSAAIKLQSPSAALAAAVIVMAMVHGLAESGSGDAIFPTFFFYCTLAGAALLRPDEELLT